MEQNVCAFYAAHVIHKSFFFLSDVLPHKHRDSGDIFRRILRVLKRMQRLCISDNTLYLIRSQPCLVCGKLGCKRFLLLDTQSLFGRHDDNGFVLIVNQILLYQFFIIIGIDFFLQILEHIDCLNHVKRHIVVIKPRVKHLKPIYQPLRVRAKICLPVPEFIEIQARKQ